MFYIGACVSVFVFPSVKTLLCVYSVVAYSTFYCFDFVSSCLICSKTCALLLFFLVVLLFFKDLYEIVSASCNIFVVLLIFGGLSICIFVCWYFVGACVRVLVLPAMQTQPCCSGKGSRKPLALLKISKIPNYINVNEIVQLYKDNLSEDFP